MADLIDLYRLNQADSELRNRVTQATQIVAGEIVLQTDNLPTDHAARKAWAVAVIGSPEHWGAIMTRFLVAQYHALETSAITGATKDTILDAVRGVDGRRHARGQHFPHRHFLPLAQRHLGTVRREDGHAGRQTSAILRHVLSGRTGHVQLQCRRTGHVQLQRGRTGRSITMTYNITSGDTLRIFSDTLQYQGAALDLTGATVKLALIEITDGEVFFVPAQITGADAGQVQYQTTDAFYAAVGSDKTYRCEWHVTLSDGSDIVVPTRATSTYGEVLVKVLPKIDTESTGATEITG